MSKPPTEFLRLLPSLDELLERPAAVALRARYAGSYVTRAARRLLHGWRSAVLAGHLSGEQLRALVNRADVELADFVALELAPRPARVVNATGVVVHTNLGRAVWPESAVKRASEAASRPCDLELDLKTGRRGRRDAGLAKGKLLFPGAEDLLVVNNCAAAVLLTLNSLAEGREVIVSRGELVEIGGSFRIPDVMAKSGARLREVGTTNRTHLSDYERALSPETAAILKVHPSNYRVEGFTRSVAPAQLVPLAREHGVPVIEDLGSGAVVSLRPYGVTEEPTLDAALSAGVDIVMASGDKLFGGPQAGLIAGKRVLMERLRSNALYRALRPDKVTLAALDACFELYLTQDAFQHVPVLRCVSLQADELRSRSQALAVLLSGGDLVVELIDSISRVGGGSAPQSELPGVALSVRHKTISCTALSAALRSAPVPVVARVEDDRVILDLRTVAPDEAELLVEAVRHASGTA